MSARWQHAHAFYFAVLRPTTTSRSARSSDNDPAAVLDDPRHTSQRHTPPFLARLGIDQRTVASSGRRSFALVYVARYGGVGAVGAGRALPAIRTAGSGARTEATTACRDSAAVRVVPAGNTAAGRRLAIAVAALARLEAAH